MIERSDETPSLEELASFAGMSVYQFHRTFKAVTGLTPKDFAEAHRSKRVRTSLETSNTVTDAIYDAGFNSNSRFYESSNELLGMTPSRFRGGPYPWPACKPLSLLLRVLFLGELPQGCPRPDAKPEIEVGGMPLGTVGLFEIVRTSKILKTSWSLQRKTTYTQKRIMLALMGLGPAPPDR